MVNSRLHIRHPHKALHRVHPLVPSPVWIHLPHILLAVVLLWAGCAAPQASSPRRIAPGTDLNIEAQARLLQNARSLLAQGSSEAAVSLLRRIIETYPQSPSLPEARWWLGRSYEQAGDLNAALDQYRVLANTAKEHSYGTEARGRIVELEKLLETTATRSNGLAAILIPAHDLLALPELDHWIQTLAHAGITTLIVEVGTGQIRHEFGQLVPIAHRHGLSLFAAMTLRRMSWLEPQFGWADSSYDPAKGHLTPSQYLDLFHPSFQEYLIGLFTDLAATGVDGVLFRAGAPLGPTDGLSAYGLRGFERDFDIKLDPRKLFMPSHGGTPATQPRAARPQQEVGTGGARGPVASDPSTRLRVSPELGRGAENATGDGPPPAMYAPEFWRWAGWKARESLKVMDRLRRAMRKHSPKLLFALEVHPEAITNPVEALARYGEDLLEAKRSRFDFYLTGSRPRIGERMPGMIEHMIDLIGEPERIWVAAPLPEGELVRLADRVKPAADRAASVKGISLIYMGNSVSVP